MEFNQADKFNRPSIGNIHELSIHKSDIIMNMQIHCQIDVSWISVLVRISIEHFKIHVLEAKLILSYKSEPFRFTIRIFRIISKHT